MGILTNIFYLISSSLLIPCMLALLWCLGRVLLYVGQTLRQYVARARTRPELDEFAKTVECGTTVPAELAADGLLCNCLNQLREVATDAALVEKLTREAELTWKTDLERLHNLVRHGPAFGLMGTLIPLGPALVGLAAGDLATLSNNLIIAFATTVVGLLVAVIAGVLLSIKKRWYQSDAILLEFVVVRLAQCELNRSEGVASWLSDGGDRIADAAAGTSRADRPSHQVGRTSTDSAELVVAGSSDREGR